MIAVSKDPDETSRLLAELHRLKAEHGDIDTATEALTEKAAADQLQLQRLKKRKLALKDRIRNLENLLTPDIIA